MRNIFICLVLFLTAYSVQGQLVYVPDSNFRAALRSQGYFVNQNNYLVTALVQNVTYLYLGGRNIADLTGIEGFTNLVNLYCENNQLTTVPNLPNTLRRFYCENNQITTIPSLPSDLNELNCSNNLLTSLPTLPQRLSYLDCSSNQITSLPSLLSTRLIHLNCNNNQLTNLPALPRYLFELRCDSNQLTSLPQPDIMLHLSCNNNQLTSLPSLPRDLRYLSCANNQLTSVPNLPNGLDTLYCGYNSQLNCLPVLPNTVSAFDCNASNVVCLPNIPPNLQNNSLSICTSNNNSNGCAAFSQVQGQVYVDLNLNGIFDSGDINMVNQPIITTNSQFVGVTDNSGFYSILLAASTSNTISLPAFYNTNHFSVTPASYTITTDTNFQIYANTNFMFSPLSTFNDLEVNITPGLYRPGFNNVFYINYRNIGVTTISGSLSLDLDANVGFISASTPTTQTGQNLIFNFSNLAPFANGRIAVLVRLPSSVPLATAINHTLNGIIANDADTTNNQYTSEDIVVGSYDPNDINADKEEICSNYPTELEEDLVYTIRFQNTGTFYAENVRVEDTLSSFLDISTFQTVATSHNYRLVFDNIITNGEHKILAKWYFDNIMLLDSFTNEPLSHGYIKYKIKPFANQLANRNEIIASQAHIYFDFNPAVNTNVDEVISNICMDVNEPQNKVQANNFQIIPNPNKGSFNLRFADNVDLENANLYIYNSLGELIMQQKLQNTNQNVIINNLPSATYIVKVQTANTTFVQKMIIE